MTALIGIQTIKEHEIKHYITVTYNHKQNFYRAVTLKIYINSFVDYTNRLTTDVLVKLKVYSLSLSPSVLSPPNNTAVSLVTDVRVNSSIGGGLSPVTAGEIHSPK